MSIDASKIITILKKTYPQAKIVLKYSNSWELLVAVVLSAQCTDKMVNKVTGELFKKYKTLDDYVKADTKKFENDIKSTGFYKDADSVKVEKQLIELLPKEEWFKFTYFIIDHGRAICKAQNPKCGICPLKSLCTVVRN